MKKIYLIILILLFGFSSFAEDWKPEEWLFAAPVFLPSPTKVERNEINPITKEKELFPKSFHKRILEELPDKINAVPDINLITPWGTTKWKKVFAVGECPAIEKPVPEGAIFFAAKYWISPEAQLAELWFGSDDASTVWLNNEKIITHAGNRAYKYGGNVLQVSLKSGTNIFVFAVINGEGPGMVGAHLFPRDFAIYPGLFLDTKNPVETEEFIELDVYWFPAAIVKPRKKVYENPPKCEKIKILDYTDNIVTQITENKIALPIQINMCRKSNGIYKIESEWNGKIHTRSFYYCGFPEKLSPSEEWKIKMLENNDFFSPEALLEQMFGEEKIRKAKGNFSAKRIHAYRSKYDNTLQPYVVMLPWKYKFTTNLPLVVTLRPYLIYDKIKYCKIQRYNDRNMVKVYPYSQGCSGGRGLSELDILEVIDLVCEEYKIDRERIYIESGSFGAASSWRVAGRYPDLFAGMLADSGYDLTYVNNLLALPILQLWMKPENPEYWLPYSLKKMEKFGADATYTDLRKLSKEEYQESIKDRTKWFLSKKRNSQPDKVVYSTFGDVDGAYWVRNIMPDWFGRMATVVGEIQVISNQYSVLGKNTKNKIQSSKNGLIHIWTENVSSFSLDLREGRFLKFKNWKIVIDGSIETNVVAGEMFSYNFYSQSGNFNLHKKNGFCGGIADVVCDSFLISYNADDEKSKEQAEKFKLAITGIKSYQFDGEFKVVADTQLTPELCEKYNVILFTSAEKPGKFLEENIEKLPFGIVEGKLKFNKHAEGWTPTMHKREACVTFPNPIASNRYLLTVTMTNFTPRILMSEHNDIILNGRLGSFDANWNKVQWQDEYRTDLCKGCKHHEHYEPKNHKKTNLIKTQSELSKQKYKKEEISRKSKLKKIGGIIFIIIFGGAGLYYFLKKE